MVITTHALLLLAHHYEGILTRGLRLRWTFRFIEAILRLGAHTTGFTTVSLAATFHCTSRFH